MKAFVGDITRILGFAIVRTILTVVFCAGASPIWLGGIVLIKKTENMWLGLALFGLAVGSLIASWHLAGGTARRMCFEKLGFRLSFMHTVYSYLGLWCYLPVVGFIFRWLMKNHKRTEPNEENA